MSSKSKAVIRIESDVNDAKNGIEQISKNLESLANRAKKNSLSDLAVGINAVTGVAKTAASAIKAVAATVNDLTATYKVQAKAETQLEAAARNNPYLSRSSVENLKKYAGELQSISIYGDEQLLPYMGELAAAGRTEKEIMDVMSAAIDVAASGTMDLGAAVKALNGTYQGSAGTLSKNVRGVKELTQEQLKNGEAVKLVAQQYKGMAEETAKATGAADQLKNAWGDFKELMGGVLENIIGPIQRGLSGIIGQLNSILSKSKEAANYKRALSDAEETPDRVSTQDLREAYKNSQNDMARQAAYVSSLKKALEYQEKIKGLNQELQYGSFSPDQRDSKLAELEGYANLYNDILRLMPDVSGRTVNDLRLAESELEDLTNQYNTINANYTQRIQEEFQAREEAAAAAARAEAERRTKEAEDERQRKLNIIKSAKEAYNERLKVAEEEARLEAELTGKSFDEVWGSQEFMKKRAETMKSGLLTAQKEMGNLYSTAWGTEQWGNEQIEIIKGLMNSLRGNDDTKLSAEDEKKLKDLQSQIMGILTPDDPNRKLSQILQERLSMLEKYFHEVLSMEGLSEEQRRLLEEQYHEAMGKLSVETNRAIAAEEDEARKAARDKMIADWQDRLSIAQEFSSKFSEIVSTLTDAALEASQAESKARLKQVENEYEQGLISETEYEEKSKEIKKKAAEEEYRLRLWQWGAQIAQITIDTAQAVMSAMTQPGNPLVNIAMASLVGAMGAAQLGTAMAQKPQAPSFASGGIVPGNSWSGDRVAANVNSGEMILTRAQQADLWRTISGGLGTGGWNVAVNNYMGGRADVSTRRTHEGLVLDIIDAHINQGMARGTYDAGMAGYSVSQKGVTIL